MALYHKWDVKNGFVCVLKLFSLISDGLGGVPRKPHTFYKDDLSVKTSAHSETLALLTEGRAGGCESHLLTPLKADCCCIV